jgi:hypothetical protein
MAPTAVHMRVPYSEVCPYSPVAGTGPSAHGSHSVCVLSTPTHT